MFQLAGLFFVVSLSGALSPGPLTTLSITEGARRGRWAGWWLVITPIAWITGLTLLPGILATGSMVGAISGIALSLLLHTPHPASAPGQTNQKESAL